MSKKSKGKKNKDFDSDQEADHAIEVKGGKSKGNRAEPESNEKVAAKSSKKKKGKKAVR